MASQNYILSSAPWSQALRYIPRAKQTGFAVANIDWSLTPKLKGASLPITIDPLTAGTSSIGRVEVVRSIVVDNSLCSSMLMIIPNDSQIGTPIPARSYVRISVETAGTLFTIVPLGALVGGITNLGFLQEPVGPLEVQNLNVTGLTTGSDIIDIFGDWSAVASYDTKLGTNTNIFIANQGQSVVGLRGVTVAALTNIVLSAGCTLVFDVLEGFTPYPISYAGGTIPADGSASSTIPGGTAILEDNFSPTCFRTSIIASVSIVGGTGSSGLLGFTARMA